MFHVKHFNFDQTHRIPFTVNTYVLLSFRIFSKRSLQFSFSSLPFSKHRPNASFQVS